MPAPSGREIAQRGRKRPLRRLSGARHSGLGRRLARRSPDAHGDTGARMTRDEVLDYCRRSANPVGRLTLKIAGFHNAALDRAADDILDDIGTIKRL